MSNYGADVDPDLAATYDLMVTKGFCPIDKTNVMQWTLVNDQVMRKIANRRNHTNILFLIQK